MSLKHEPSAEPLHIPVTELYPHAIPPDDSRVSRHLATPNPPPPSFQMAAGVVAGVTVPAVVDDGQRVSPHPLNPNTLPLSPSTPFLV